MNEWKTGAKLADDKPERWPHGWTHRSVGFPGSRKTTELRLSRHCCAGTRAPGPQKITHHGPRPESESTTSSGGVLARPSPGSAKGFGHTLDGVLPARDVHDGHTADMPDALTQVLIAGGDYVAAVLLGAVEDAVVLDSLVIGRIVVSKFSTERLMADVMRVSLEQ